MPHTDVRSVKENYWYTSAQMLEVGMAWAMQSTDRLFIFSNDETFNITGLNINNVPSADQLPKKIMLPLNLGRGHWTAVTVNASIIQPENIHVHISFTDSLNRNIPIDKQNLRVQNELARISNLFREKYNVDNIIIDLTVYAHSWAQNDGCSCGPYSLANAARCLDGAGAEPNPGQRAIREQQLNLMTSWVAYSGCSTNRLIDEVLLNWIEQRRLFKAKIQLENDADVAEICKYNAEKFQKNYKDIEELFYEEYCPRGNRKLRYVPVNIRINELLHETKKFLPIQFFSNKAPSITSSPVCTVAASDATYVISKALQNLPTRQDEIPNEFYNLSREEIIAVIKTETIPSHEPIIKTTNITTNKYAKVLDELNRLKDQLGGSPTFGSKPPTLVDPDSNKTFFGLPMPAVKDWFRMTLRENWRPQIFWSSVASLFGVTKYDRSPYEEAHIRIQRFEKLMDNIDHFTQILKNKDEARYGDLCTITGLAWHPKENGPGTHVHGFH